MDERCICTVWLNTGKLPDTVSKWHTYATLTQVVRELGMKQSIFNPNTQGQMTSVLLAAFEKTF